MIWVILFFIIILISSVLAYRSMRDYEEFPDILNLSSLYFIGNPQNLNVETLKKLHDFFLAQNHFFSLEKLIKGKEKARVLYGPANLSKDFPELNLVEIEDYLGNVDHTLSWLIEPKNNPKKALLVDEELRNLIAGEGQKIFIQIILMPDEKSGGLHFQATLRAMVVDPDPIKRVGLAKKVTQIFATSTGLHKHEDDYPETKKYESFKQRSLIPKEVSDFPLASLEVAALMS